MLRLATGFFFMSSGATLSLFSQNSTDQLCICDEVQAARTVYTLLHIACGCHRHLVRTALFMQFMSKISMK